MAWNHFSLWAFVASENCGADCRRILTPTAGRWFRCFTQLSHVFIGRKFVDHERGKSLRSIFNLPFACVCPTVCLLSALLVFDLFDTSALLSRLI